jgi:hypothetical protein
MRPTLAEFEVKTNMFGQKPRDICVQPPNAAGFLRRDAALPANLHETDAG